MLTKKQFETDTLDSENSIPGRYVNCFNATERSRHTFRRQGVTKGLVFIDESYSQSCKGPAGECDYAHARLWWMSLGLHKRGLFAWTVCMDVCNGSLGACACK